MNSQDIEQLKVHFLSKLGGAISGAIKPNQTDLIDLGTPDQRFRTIYAKEIVADSGSGGSDGGNADTVDGFHASADVTPNAILPLDGLGVYPPEVYHLALLTTGERALTGNLDVAEGYTVDGIDLSAHTHNGMFGHGQQIDHRDLLANDANVHPQYAQKDVDEVITGDWMFTDFEDRSVGWLFEPSTKTIKAYPNNLALVALPGYAEIQLGAHSEILAHVDSTDAFLRIGADDAGIHLDGSHATHRMWAGAVLPADAPFSVDNHGLITATAGSIGGWNVQSDRIEANYLTLLSAGELRLGDGSLNLDKKDTTVLSAIDPDGWRMWFGSDSPADSTFKINRWGQAFLGDAYVSGLLRSSNYVEGRSGFSLDQDGRAEFNDIIARGRIETAVFSERRISAVSGTMMVADASTLKEAVSGTDESIIVDSAIFSKDDILVIKGSTDTGGGVTSFTEYMKVAGEAVTVDTDKYRYPVIRDLSGDGAQNFKVGDALVRMGNATQGKPIHPVASGEPGAEYGTQQPGGTGSNIEGGWLVLEGARGVGPYFAVARRRGPVYNQFDEVVRIGNLRGISVLDATKTDNNPYYGAFIGDAAAYLAYDADTGLRIKTRSGATAIDVDGITTDQFTLAIGSLPDFAEDRAALYLWDDGGAPKVGIRMQTSGVQRDILEIASVDHTHTGYVLTSGLSEWDELTATPATPSATKYRLYFKDDGRLYSLNDLGVEVDVGQGPQGEQGPEGPAGTPGTSYLGAWNDTTNYEENDIVSYGADTWVCLVPNTDHVPSYIADPGDPLYWAPLGTYLGSVQLAEVIHGMDAETAILDDDEFISSSSFSQLDEVPQILPFTVSKRVSFGLLKSELETYFDTVYAAANDYLLTSGLSEWEEQGGTPAAPAATKHKVYFKSDGKLYTLDSSDAEQEVGSGASGSGGGGGGDWTAIIDGALAPSEDVAAFVAGSNVEIIGVYVRCRVLGSSLSTIVDVNVDGVTIFTDQANRPELQFDSPANVAQSGEQDAVDVAAGSVVTVDIDQAAVDAEDLAVTIVLQKAITGGVTVDLTDQVDGVTSSFALPETPLQGTVSVFLNGVRQSEAAGHFSIVGVTLTLDTVPVAGDILEVQYYLADIGYGNVDTLDGMHADEFAPADVSGSAVMQDNYVITGDDVWEDTGLSLYLPSAGKYELHGGVRGALRATFTPGSSWLVTKFFNTTLSEEVVESERMVVLTGTSNVQFQMTAPIYKQITVNGPTTISLYVMRSSSDSGVVWSTSLLGSNSAGRTEISFKKIA